METFFWDSGPFTTEILQFIFIFCKSESAHPIPQSQPQHVLACVTPVGVCVCGTGLYFSATEEMDPEGGARPFPTSRSMGAVASSLHHHQHNGHEPGVSKYNMTQGPHFVGIVVRLL